MVRFTCSHGNNPKARHVNLLIQFPLVFMIATFVTRLTVSMLVLLRTKPLDYLAGFDSAVVNLNFHV